ncbi:MAG: hypothetical protein K6F05_08275 [Succinivibrio sp.]|nr:hypothetical protein [Succinivibrio sp.]
MFITIAVIIIVLATFLLIIVNMFSDYTARREADMRLIINHAHNIIAETEELLLNQNQLPYSRTLVLVLHLRIIRALKKRLLDQKQQAQVKERIAEEQGIINEIKAKYKDTVAFKPPENDTMAMNQLRAIRRLRNILKSELKAGIPLNPSDIQKEDRRLYMLVLKVNISNLVQRVLEMKRLHQIGTCKQLIVKGLDVINKAGVKDGWLAEKADLLNQLQKGLDAEAKSTKKKKSAQPAAKSEEAKEMDEIFGDKKKW